MICKNFLFLFVISNILGTLEGKDSRPLHDIYTSAKAFSPSNDYVHTWIPFPILKGQSPEGKDIEIKTAVGKVNIYIFIASWCTQCQNIMSYLKSIEKQADPTNSRFIYIFSHDLAKDAQGFISEYKLRNETILANHNILKDFHNPELPTIYISDRYGWLLSRFTKVDLSNIKEIQTLVAHLTSY